MRVHLLFCSGELSATGWKIRAQSQQNRVQRFNSVPSSRE